MYAQSHAVHWTQKCRNTETLDTETNALLC